MLIHIGDQQVLFNGWHGIIPRLIVGCLVPSFPFLSKPLRHFR